MPGLVGLLVVLMNIKTAPWVEAGHPGAGDIGCEAYQSMQYFLSLQCWKQQFPARQIKSIFCQLNLFFSRQFVMLCSLFVRASSDFMLFSFTEQFLIYARGFRTIVYPHY